MILPNKGKDGDSTFEETLLCKLSPPIVCPSPPYSSLSPIHFPGTRGVEIGGLWGMKVIQCH